MSSQSPASRRPMSPFMIGPYYKPQLTSMLSITHRGTGVFLTFGGFLLAWWLISIAGGPDDYALFQKCMGGLIGRLILAGLVFSLVFHWLNGLRHLMWDIGWGLEIPRTYATGWTVLALSIALTGAILWMKLMPGGAS